MASKLAIYNTGYDDDLFEHAVSSSLHCIICTNVIRDPVACRHNEHLFCRTCITEHLKNHQTCPSCMDPLTVDTLSQPPRTVMNLLAELKIRCKFFDRGCAKFMELGNLENHLRECGFAPAVCSNEGCELEVNKRDLLHHETAVCEQRRVKCHNCSDIRQEMDLLKVNLAAVIEKLERIEMNGKAVEENLMAKVELVQEQLKKHEESTCRQLNKQGESILGLETEMVKSLNEITKQLERMTRDISHGKEQVKKGIAEAAGIDREPKVVVVGGITLNSVEMFTLSNGTWTFLQPMRENRYGASLVVYNNQLIVMGGHVKSMKKLSLSVVEANQSITWENFPAKLPGQLCGHCSLVYNGQCIVIGGYDSGKDAYSDKITVISLVPPYASKLLSSMQESRCYHGIILFGDVIVIVGGRENGYYDSALRTVVRFYITKIEYEELAPLPYPVCEMATVKWGDDNIIIIGGADSAGKPLKTVLMYNVKTQKSYMLPDMKYKRKECVAVVVRDTVIVMGGEDEGENCLKSVESFKFDRYTWEELPEMQEGRSQATAVVC